MSPAPDSTLADPQQVIADLRRERDEGLAREAANAEVLSVINSSSGDLQAVFEAILKKAMSLGEASFGGLFICEGERYRAVATRGVPRQLDEIARQGFVPKPNPRPRG